MPAAKAEQSSYAGNASAAAAFGLAPEFTSTVAVVAAAATSAIPDSGRGRNSRAPIRRRMAHLGVHSGGPSATGMFQGRLIGTKRSNRSAGRLRRLRNDPGRPHLLQPVRVQQVDRGAADRDQ